MLRNQKFGVEIEMTGISRGRAADVVAEVLQSTVQGPISNGYNTRSIRDSDGRVWKVMRDGSINPQPAKDEFKVEFVTPPLNYGDMELLQNIVRRLKENGAIANSSCGIHVHVDGANHNAKSLRRLVNFMTSRQDLIYEALEIGARGSRWCKKLSPKILTELKKKRDITNDTVENIWYSTVNDNYYGGIDHQHYNETRYHGVNLHSYFSKGTVEFRLFNGTMHAGKIKAYVQFCLAVSAWAITSEEKIVFRSMDGYTANQKVTIMRNILVNRLGLSGEEFKTCRLHLMTPLKKNAVSNAA